MESIPQTETLEDAKFNQPTTLEKLAPFLKSSGALQGIAKRAQVAALAVGLALGGFQTAKAQTITNPENLSAETIEGLRSEIAFARSFLLGPGAQKFLANIGYSESEIAEEITERRERLDQALVIALDRYVYADAVLTEIQEREEAGLPGVEVELERDDIAKYTSGVAFAREADVSGKVFTNLHLYDANNSDMNGTQTHELFHVATSEDEPIQEWFSTFLKKKYQPQDSNPDSYNKYLAQPGELYGHAAALSKKIAAAGMDASTITEEDLKKIKKMYPKEPLMLQAKNIFNEGLEGLAEMLRGLNGSNY